MSTEVKESIDFQAYFRSSLLKKVITKTILSGSYSNEGSRLAKKSKAVKDMTFDKLDNLVIGLRQQQHYVILDTNWSYERLLQNINVSVGPITLMLEE